MELINHQQLQLVRLKDTLHRTPKPMPQVYTSPHDHRRLCLSLCLRYYRPEHCLVTPGPTVLRYGTSLCIYAWLLFLLPLKQ